MRCNLNDLRFNCLFLASISDEHETPQRIRAMTMENSKNDMTQPRVSGMQNQIRHAACRWCYEDIPLEQFCREGKEIGLAAIDLLETSDFETIRKYDLDCPVVTFPTTTTNSGIKVGMIEKAFNRLEHHDALVEVYERKLKDCASVSAKQLICFSGNREGLDDQQGLENCAIGLERLLPTAEKLGITLIMELLNSRVDHYSKLNWMKLMMNF